MGGSPGGFDMNNPMIMGLLSLFASQNPQTAGPMLDQMGVPVPGGIGGGGQPSLGGMVNPMAGRMSLGGPTQEQPSTMESMPLGPAAVAGAMQPQTSPQIPPFQTTVQPEMQSTAAPAAAPAGGMNPQQLAQLAAMGGVKAPPPIQPIMNGGVTGGVKPPEAQLGGGFGTGVPPGIAMLLQSMASGQRQNPLVAPDLGSLIRGRG